MRDHAEANQQYLLPGKIVLATLGPDRGKSALSRTRPIQISAIHAVQGKNRIMIALSQALFWTSLRKKLTAVWDSAHPLGQRLLTRLKNIYIFVFSGHGCPQPFSLQLSPLLYCNFRCTSGDPAFISCMYPGV